MVDYSAGFLNDNWSCAGDEFELCCVFQERRVTKNSLLNFLLQVKSSFHMCEIYFLPTIETCHQFTQEAISNSEALFETELQFVPAQFEARLRESTKLDLGQDSWREFYATFTAPNEFSFGSHAEYFFTGSNEFDRRRVQNIVQLAFLAQKNFGDAITQFAAEYYVQRSVRDKEASKAKPNLTSDSNSDEWVDQMMMQLDEVRIASISK